MNPMALMLALLATAGAVSSLGGGRQRGVTDDDDNQMDDDGASTTDAGSSEKPGRTNKTDEDAAEPVFGPITMPEAPVQTGGTGSDGGSVAPTAIEGDAITVMTGRVKTLEPSQEDIASIRIVSQPEHGHVAVNPDNTLALVLTETQATGAMSFKYEVTHSDGSTSLHTTPLTVTPGVQEQGWGTGENHYMLEVDENDRVIVEHGENHRAVYISNSDKALSLADIAAREGLAVDKITGSWLAARPEYGASEDMALAPDAGMRLWSTVTAEDSSTSNWLLFERGHQYGDLSSRLIPTGASGETELNPILIGAWGEGDKPEITDSIRVFKKPSENIVFQDLHASGGIQLLSQNNVIFDGLKVTQSSLNVQWDSSGITVRNTSFLDIHREEPIGDQDFWEAGANKLSGLFVQGGTGLLMEGNFFDMIGWEEDYRYDLSTEGGQPPSKFSQGIYIQRDTFDVTLRDSIIMRVASVGAQLRGGGFAEDNVFIDNEVGLHLTGVTGNYGLASDNVVTSAGYKEVSAGGGALNWGINNLAFNTFVDNIVAHMADPNNPEEIAQKTIPGRPYKTSTDPFYNDTITWNWGPDANTDGLDPGILDQTTIQLFTAGLLGKPDATINDLAAYLRAQADGALDDVVDADLIVRFFQSGFGIVPDIRTEDGMLRFVPDELGDGVRWDNRLNWSSEDLPGSVAGDSVDLGGNKVTFGGTVTIDEMEFGPNGGLRLEHGKLTVTGGVETGEEGATLDVNGAGQIWTEGGRGEGMLDTDVTGGRFANTGVFKINADLTASGGQTLLGVDGATYAVTSGSRLEVVGDAAKVGFDGEENGISILGIDNDGTLAFTAKDGALGSIGEFRSGALGDAPKVLSGADLGGGNLDIDLTELVDGQGMFTLLDVDELIGAFGEVNVTGLGSRDAEIVIDYETDAIHLNLAAGSGAVKTSSVGDEGLFDDGEAALWDALTAGKGTYDEAEPAEDDEDFLFAA